MKWTVSQILPYVSVELNTKHLILVVSTLATKAQLMHFVWNKLRIEQTTVLSMLSLEKVIIR